MARKQVIAVALVGAALFAVLATSGTSTHAALTIRGDVYLPFGAVAEGHRFALGTDREGRDFAWALLGATGVSLRFAAAGTAAVLFASLAIGLVQGLWQRRLVTAAIGVTTLGLMAVPDIALLATVRNAWPRELANVTSSALAALVNTSVVGTLALLLVPTPSRLIADRVRSTSHSLFVAASRASGASPLYTFRHDVLPHLTEDVGWIAAMVLPRFIHIEVGLSYLGLGYRGPDGLGALLKASFDNFQIPAAAMQLVATTIVLMCISITPPLLARMLGIGQLGEEASS